MTAATDRPPVPAASTVVGGVACVASPHPPNPFSTRFVRPGAIPYRFSGSLQHEVSDRYGAESMPERLVRQLARRGVGLIVGPHGSGKSTLLQTLRPVLQQRYPAVGWVRLTAAVSLPPWSRLRRCLTDADVIGKKRRGLRPGGLLVVDGLEQLHAAGRFRLRASLRGAGCDLLATSHRPLAGYATLFRTRITAAIVRELTESLVATASPAVQAAVGRSLQRLDAGRIDNLRDYWFELYDVVETTIAVRGASCSRPGRW